MNTKQNTNHASDLEWLAFCYVAGELPAHEAAAFETRLGEDQAAREAVSRAVELGQLLTHVPVADWQSLAAPAAPRPGHSSPLRYAAAAVLALAACLALMAWQPWRTLNTGSPVAFGSPELAEAWSQGFADDVALHETSAAFVAENDPLELAEVITPDLEPDDMEPRAALASELPQVPSWMLAAVAKEDMLPPHNTNEGDIRIE